MVSAVVVPDFVYGGGPGLLTDRHRRREGSSSCLRVNVCVNETDEW